MLQETAERVVVGARDEDATHVARRGRLRSPMSSR